MLRRLCCFGNFRKIFSTWALFYSTFAGFLVRLHIIYLSRSVKNITGDWFKNILKKLHGQEGKKLFCKTKKSSHKNIQYSSHLLPGKFPRKSISRASRKAKMPNCVIFVPVPTIVETAMEAFPLLILYLLNKGRLDLALNMC